VGYGILVGFGAFFALVCSALAYFDVTFGGHKDSSEHFQTASRNIKAGLIAGVHPLSFVICRMHLCLQAPIQYLYRNMILIRCACVHLFATSSCGQHHRVCKVWSPCAFLFYCQQALWALTATLHPERCRECFQKQDIPQQSSSGNDLKTFGALGVMILFRLYAVDVVSHWTWSITLLQSSTVAWNYGVSGPFWYVPFRHCFS